MSNRKQSEQLKKGVGENPTPPPRALRWEFNPRLVRTSITFVTVAAVMVGLGYWYQSSNISASIQDRADKAGETNDWETQLTWLQQLKILKPDDPGIAVAVAEAAEKTIELPPANRYDRVRRARNLMSEAVAIHRKKDADDQQGVIENLERRLIERELQFGPLYASSIRRSVITLNADNGDKDLLRAFAMAKYAIEGGDETTVSELDQQTIDKAGDFWLWLDQQPLAQILTIAWKANLQDTELAARLARELLERPDSFPTDEATGDIPIEATLKSQFAKMTNNGQAQLILYSLLSPTSPKAADSLLDEQVDGALVRLVKQNASLNKQNDVDLDNATTSGAPLRTLPPIHSKQSYRPVWDFNLVITWARAKLQKANPDHDQVNAVLDQLLALTAPKIPAAAIEEAYVLRTLERPEQEASNINEILLAGIERLGIDSPNLQLQRAAKLSSDGELQSAKAAVRQFDQTLQARRARIVSADASQLTSLGKATEETQLDRFTWNKDVMLGVIANREGLLGNARQILRVALRSQVSVPTQQRLQAMLLLADVYRRMGTWDLAATIYEEASALSPNQPEIRVLAANAWTASGNVSNAFQQWKALEGTSLPLQVQQLRALIAEEFAKPPSRRNFESIWQRLDTLTAKLSKLAVEDDQQQSLRSELALLALSVPDRDDGTTRKSTIQRLIQLADDSPQNASLQKAAAFSLVQAGKTDIGRTFIERLREIEGDDSPSFTLTNAKFEAASGNLESAIERLLAYAANHPEDVRKSKMLAAEYIAKEKDLGRAYDVLMSIPAPQHTPQSCFRGFTYALAMLAQPPTNETDFSKLKAAEKLLLELDEPSETWWKLQKAMRLLEESRIKDLPAADKQALIAQASQLSGEVNSIRPRWGLGLSLAGQVSSARGETLSAIQSLQAGMSNGDVRLSSSYLLTQLLLKMNRVAEAEVEYSRFARLRQASSNIAAFGVTIAERKGEYTKSLELARKTAEANEKDEIAWLLVAQAAMMAARATDEKLAKDDLLSESRTSLDIALALSEDTSVRAYQMLLRFRAEFFDEEALRDDIMKLSNSKVKEPIRSLLAGLSYIQIEDSTSAFPLLKRAQEYAPSDAQVFVALSQYYQLVGDNQNLIASLEQAFKLAPSRVDIRNRLAIALALRSGSDIPWPRLKSLLDTNLIGDSQNKILHALILLNRGNKEKEVQAEQILVQLVRANGPKADDARRLLASLLRRRWGIAASIDKNSPDAQRALAEARGVYLALVNREKPKPLDIYRLGDLLLRAQQTQDVTALADQLDSITKGSPVALDLRLRLAKQSGDSNKIEQYAKSWANRAMEVDGLLQASVWETAGQLLSNLGYHKESIDWLERAYRDDSEKFRPYVLGLTRARRFNEALKLCTEQYTTDHAAKTAAVLADVAVLMGLGLQARPLSEKEQTVLTNALKEHPKNASLLEAIATLRLAQERYSEAIPLYQESAKFSPDNVRLLNNLAMALSEISGREAEALPYAKKAIELYGRSPELLDTLGLVLVRNDEAKKAEQVLREAVSASPDPRYRFHLLIALLGQEKRVEAISEWSQLDLDILRKAALTPAERRDLNQIRKRFEG